MAFDPTPPPDIAALYRAPREHAALVDVPDAEYAMLDGTGSPWTASAFEMGADVLLAIGAAVRRHLAEEHPPRIEPPAPIEAVWRWDHGAGAWRWTLMTRQPANVPPHVLAKALRDVAVGEHAATVRSIHFSPYHEGRAMQRLHVGPYAREMDTIQHLFAEIEEEGYLPAGPVHEIYLSDPETTPSDEWETIVRQPVKGPGHFLG